MKNTSILMLFIAILLITGCIQHSNTASLNVNDSVKQELTIKTYLDSTLSKHPNCLDNDINKKDLSDDIKKYFVSKKLGDNMQCITELPLEFEMLLPYNDNKYVVKFSYGETFSEHKISDKYKVTFQVFSIVDKKTASKLKEKSHYYIKGKFVGFANKKSFRLPSGGYVDAYPNVSESEGLPYIDLGTLIVTNLTFSEI